jgi:hypothetical protein
MKSKNLFPFASYLKVAERCYVNDAAAAPPALVLGTKFLLDLPRATFFLLFIIIFIIITFINWNVYSSKIRSG